MGTKTLMSVEEYLHTTFDGADREYIDGEVIERNMGNKSHSAAQGEFFFRFRLERDRTGLVALPELRHRLGERRFRIPDVAVFESELATEIPETAPLVAIEVLFPDARVGYIILKLGEYRARGVQHIWIADPEDRKFFTYSEDGLHEVSELTLPRFGVTITKAEIFGA